MVRSTTVICLTSLFLSTEQVQRGAIGCCYSFSSWESSNLASSFSSREAETVHNPKVFESDSTFKFFWALEGGFNLVQIVAFFKVLLHQSILKDEIIEEYTILFLSSYAKVFNHIWNWLNVLLDKRFVLELFHLIDLNLLNLTISKF